MPVTFNLHELDNGDKVLRLKGKLSSSELDLEGADELIHLHEPLSYDLEIQKGSTGILARGKLHIDLVCECVRCLESFPYSIRLEDWACLLPLEGEEKVAVINDFVDLTPYLREDIVLAFPQHPLCNQNCQGLAAGKKEEWLEPGGRKKSSSAATPWAELDKLKF